MSETRAPYTVPTHPNPTGIPTRWLRFLYRMAALKGGRVYMVAITIPDKANCEPTWTFVGDGPIENKG